jgi:hypothetical protein
MSFDLTIAVSGLCLLVPDEGRCIHVLMPSTDEGEPEDESERDQRAEAHGTERGSGHSRSHAGGRAHTPVLHSAQLIYNAAHLREGAARTPAFVLDPLADYALDLSKITGGEGDSAREWAPGTELPDDLLDLSKLTGGAVHPDLVGDRPGERVIARVTLPPGELLCHEPGVQWSVQPTEDGPAECRFIAWMIQWVVRGVPHDSLDLSLLGLNGMPGRPLGTLYPIKRQDDSRSIRLWVYHVPPEHMPPLGKVPQALDPGTEMPHLPGTYKLLDVGGRAVAEPVVRYIGPGPTGRSTPCSVKRPSGWERFVSQSLRARVSSFYGDSWTCTPPKAALGSADVEIG